MAGRDERRVAVGEEVGVIHLQTRNEWVASTLEAINRLRSALEGAGGWAGHIGPLRVAFGPPTHGPP